MSVSSVLAWRELCADFNQGYYNTNSDARCTLCSQGGVTLYVKAMEEKGMKQTNQLGTCPLNPHDAWTDFRIQLTKSLSRGLGSVMIVSKKLDKLRQSVYYQISPPSQCQSMHCIWIADVATPLSRTRICRFNSRHSGRKSLSEVPTLFFFHCVSSTIAACVWWFSDGS